MNSLLFILIGCVMLTNCTDYQNGFYDGARAGLEVGMWQGMSKYGTGLPSLETACKLFNDLLIKVFGNSDHRTAELWQTIRMRSTTVKSEVYGGWLGVV